MESKPRKAYPTDVSDDEWAFVAPYLTLMAPDAPQRVHDLREVFDALRRIVHTRSPCAPSPGRPASAAWPRTTNACRIRWQGSTSWRSSVQCSIASSPSSRKLHNRL